MVLFTLLINWHSLNSELKWRYIITHLLVWQEKETKKVQQYSEWLAVVTSGGQIEIKEEGAR